MGRKQIRAWKYFHLCITCLIFLSFLGCATLKEIEKEWEARECIARGKKLFAQGDYEASLKENQKALSISGNNSPGDEALFNMGLIYAYSEYLKKDYKKSISFFTRVVKDYPKSHLVEQARIWIGILQENERLNKVIEELKNTVEKSKQVDIEVEEKKKLLK